MKLLDVRFNVILKIYDTSTGFNVRMCHIAYGMYHCNDVGWVEGNETVYLRSIYPRYSGLLCNKLLVSLENHSIKGNSIVQQC